MVTQSLTQPYYITTMPTTVLPVTFVEETR